MADVRLTATNPLDSSVVPVACNDKGELLVDGAGSGDFPGNITVAGSGDFGSIVTAGMWFQSNRTSSGNSCFVALLNGTENVNITAGGNATFTGNVTAANINTFADRLQEALNDVQNVEEIKAALHDAISALKGA